VIVGLTVAPLPARAHPSDFRTLTIDLIFGQDGLEAIDAAVVESSGPGYEPFPSLELRQAVAEDVLAALDLSDAAASIDAAMSERYHQVGFLIKFEEPFPGHQETFQLDTNTLQAIAENTDLERLKLSVCADVSETFNALEIDASRDGRAPIYATNERPWCRTWEVAIADSPVTVSVQALALPQTGLPVVPAAIAGLSLLAAGYLILLRQRLPESSR
jgi:hypothetical protein